MGAFMMRLAVERTNGDFRGTTPPLERICRATALTRDGAEAEALMPVQTFTVPREAGTSRVYHPGRIQSLVREVAAVLLSQQAEVSYFLATGFLDIYISALLQLKTNHTNSPLRGVSLPCWRSRRQ